MAPLRTLRAALNSEMPSMSRKSESGALDPVTQLFIENILIERKGLDGLLISTQPLADTEPPSPMLAMLYVERGMVTLPSITLLAWSHNLAAEQVAPGRNLAGWRMSSLLECWKLSW